MRLAELHIAVETLLHKVHFQTHYTEAGMWTICVCVCVCVLRGILDYYFLNLATRLLRVGQALGKNPYYCAASQGSFDHCGLDGNDNYVSLFCTGNVWQLSPIPSAP